MMRKVISGIVGAAALVAVAGTALVHAQAQGTPAPQERQAGPRRPGGPRRSVGARPVRPSRPGRADG
jgi:hypothetical protein